MVNPLQPAVIENFAGAYAPTNIESLESAGGFSGATFWRLTTGLGDFCLRRWPTEHPDAIGLARIHATLRQAFHNGFTELALPVETVRGETFVSHDGYLWELSNWLPGRADYLENPNRTKLRAAMTALGRFHVAVDSDQHIDTSAAVSSRLNFINRLTAEGNLQNIARNVRHGDWPEVAHCADRILNLFSAQSAKVEYQLRTARNSRLPIQTCLRDIWHDHVLYSGDEVTGIVDYGAMGFETVAGDVARLLGSLAADDQSDWEAGLDAYQQIRPLTDAEREMVKVLDQSSVLLSGISWLEWIYVENRQFSNRNGVIRRLQQNLFRLEQL